MMAAREDSMNGPANSIDKADEAQLLATIDRWVEREVAARVKEFDHADRWPAEIVEQMKELGLFGATVSPEYGGLGLPARTYAEIVMKVSSVWMAITGIFNSHLMLALAIEKFGTEPQPRHWLPRLAPGEGGGGPAGADRARRRHRPAGDPPDGAARGRPLRAERHQDLDLQRHRGFVLRASGQDQPRSLAALLGHEPGHGPQGAGLPRRPQAREARLQVDRFGRADLRGLSHSGRPFDRRGRSPRLHPGGGRAGARPHQCRRPR